MVAVGDKVWFVPDGFPIVILCTVLNVDDYGDLWLDEAVGHDIDETDIALSREEAATQMIEQVNEAAACFLEGDGPNYLGLEVEADYTLAMYRKARIHFISEVAYDSGYAEWHCAWPDKSRDEWMSLNDAHAQRGMSRSEFEELYGDNEDD